MKLKNISQSTLKEYRPTILFLLRFLGIYIIGNVLYGLWVVSYDIADPVTQMVTYNTAYLLKLAGIQVTTFSAGIAPNISLQQNGVTILNVYEGCNAINVSILFVAFLFAYKGQFIKTLAFSLVGLIAIYIFNLIRLTGLFLIAIYYHDHFYFTHRFVFTGVIYAFVFGLWFIWVTRFQPQRTQRRY